MLPVHVPTGMDPATVTTADLRTIQRSPNGRTRKTRGDQTPSETFAELVAATG